MSLIREIIVHEGDILDLIQELSDQSIEISRYLDRDGPSDYYIYYEPPIDRWTQVFVLWSSI